VELSDSHTGLQEGWYLMSIADLEIELARWRHPDEVHPPSNARPLSVTEALEYREAGNRPDELGRTLRLVLIAQDDEELAHLHDRRAHYEPDFHQPPAWRRAGSRPVNLVPLRASGVVGRPGAWWDDPQVATLEEEWRRTGRMAGLQVPGEYRGFVLKTVLALRTARLPVTAQTVADSLARWVPAHEAERIRAALRAQK
jgi:hypothetical protein